MHKKYKQAGFAQALPFLFPSLFGLILFSFIPIVASMFVSLTSWDGLSKLQPFSNDFISKFYVGFDHFGSILKDPDFWKTFRNTLYYIVLYIPLITITSIGLASVLNKKYRGIGFYRVIYYLPVLTSWVAGAVIWRFALSPKYGIINGILSLVGIEGPKWLQSETWAMPAIVLASIWKDVGFTSLIFLGGLQGINPSYYESADIDGANSWAKFKKITLPLLSPVTFFVFITSIIGSFQIFAQVQVLAEANAGPNGATQVFVERIYTNAFDYNRMGYASAYSWILFGIIFILTMIQMSVQRKWVHYDD